ncbi:MAG: hypothetical protein IT163_06865 [Bryobacterales bacterium]|nr:hypothetical protein [Bryobacterales bacterium]
MKHRRVIRYSPLESQAAFHGLRARFKGFSGPVGSGKSKALCYEAIRLSYENRGGRGLLGAPTYRMLLDAAVPALVETLESHRLPFLYKRTGQQIVLQDIGSTIYLRGLAESTPLRGLNLSWFGVDELTYATEEAWQQLEARLRDPRAREYCGFGVWTPKGQDWVYRRFVESRDSEYGLVLAKPFENRHILGRNPRYYDVLKNSYTERDYQQEVLGEYTAADSNLVYGAFERAKNVAACAYQAKQPLLWAFDFNVDPMCSVVAQRVGKEVHVIDEIVLRRSGTEEMCGEFANRYGLHEGQLRVYGDASGHARSTKGASDYDLVRRSLRRCGGIRYTLTAPRRNPAVRDRVALVNALMKNAAGERLLKVDGRCKELIQDFIQMKFKDGSSMLDKDSDGDRSHLSDALGYLLWQEFAETGTVGERALPLF